MAHQHDATADAQILHAKARAAIDHHEKRPPWWAAQVKGGNAQGGQ